MTAPPAVPPAPSRAHVLMREGRTALLARYFALDVGPGGVAATAAARYWTREQITAAIITIEQEEPEQDVATDV